MSPELLAGSESVSERFERGECGLLPRGLMPPLIADFHSI
jgi:hypothetical protein